MTAFTLKLIAMILMVGDHVFSFIPHQPMFLTLMGRLVSPIFEFFMVEAFFHTRSKFNYAKRLLMGGVIMVIGNKLLMYFIPGGSFITNNIFLSLFTCFCMIWAIDAGGKAQGEKKLTFIPLYLLAILFAGLTLFTEGSIFTLSASLVFYFTRNNKTARNIAYPVVIFIATIGINMGMYIANPMTLLFNLQWFSMFAIIPICFYNGERGLNTKFSKNLFYYFYPLHIWILYTIGTFLK